MMNFSLKCWSRRIKRQNDSYFAAVKPECGGRMRATNMERPFQMSYQAYIQTQTLLQIKTSVSANIYVLLVINFKLAFKTSLKAQRRDSLQATPCRCLHTEQTEINYLVLVIGKEYGCSVKLAEWIFGVDSYSPV